MKVFMSDPPLSIYNRKDLSLMLCVFVASSYDRSDWTLGLDQCPVSSAHQEVNNDDTYILAFLPYFKCPCM